MICTVTGRRCQRLYTIAGYPRFASREALGLAYASQREAWTERALRRGRKALKCLGGLGDLDEVDALPEPKWMRWATYEAEMAKAREADEAWVIGFGQSVWGPPEQI